MDQFAFGEDMLVFRANRIFDQKTGEIQEVALVYNKLFRLEDQEMLSYGLTVPEFYKAESPVLGSRHYPFGLPLMVKDPTSGDALIAFTQSLMTNDPKTPGLTLRTFKFTGKLEIALNADLNSK